GWRPAALPATGSVAEIPPYLHGRFGPKPRAVMLAAADGRQFEPGCLVYPNTDAADPLAAIGVILGRGADGSGTRALLSRAALADHPSLCVRDTSGPVPVTILEPREQTAAGARS
ncbi:MAG TPA: hypothetical protein GYA10_04340, partial [Alphaproteobacteria bacterium]|nr:hypothetical protein [Alphaproteobacteria bacterium]